MIFFAFAYCLHCHSSIRDSIPAQGTGLILPLHTLVLRSYSRPNQRPSASIFSSCFSSVPLLLTARSNNPSFVFTHCQIATFWPQKSFLFCCCLYLSDYCCGNFFWDAFLLCGRDTDDCQVRYLKTRCSLTRWMGLLPFSEPQTDAQSGEMIFHPAAPISGASLVCLEVHPVCLGYLPSKTSGYQYKLNMCLTAIDKVIQYCFIIQRCPGPDWIFKKLFPPSVLALALPPQ